MARTSVLTTRVLLTTAAIGVATGLLAGIAGWVTPLVLVTAPILYGFVLGAHVLPGIIAQEVIRLPWVALLTHVFAALVASAMAPQWALRFLGTAILFGGIQELVAALTRYRVPRAVGTDHLPDRGRTRPRRLDCRGPRHRRRAASRRRRPPRMMLRAGSPGNRNLGARGVRFS